MGCLLFSERYEDSTSSDVSAFDNQNHVTVARRHGAGYYIYLYCCSGSPDVCSPKGEVGSSHATASAMCRRREPRVPEQPTRRVVGGNLGKNGSDIFAHMAPLRFILVRRALHAIVREKCLADRRDLVVSNRLTLEFLRTWHHSRLQHRRSRSMIDPHPHWPMGMVFVSDDEVFERSRESDDNFMARRQLDGSGWLVEGCLDGRTTEVIPVGAWRCGFWHDGGGE